MQIYIVDNGSIHLPELLKLCGPARSTVVPVDGLTRLKPNTDSIFVLSGSHERGVVGNEDYYKPEIDLIAAAPRPIIGICLGFELIAHQAGAGLKRIEHNEVGTINIYPTPEGTNWFGEHSLPVTEGHHWVVADTPPGYLALAQSKDGIEAIGNLTKGIIGFQFHPETVVSDRDGAEVFRRVLGRLAEPV